MNISMMNIVLLFGVFHVNVNLLYSFVKSPCFSRLKTHSVIGTSILFSTPENKTPSTSTSTNDPSNGNIRRSENIDLFAAGDRKPSVASLPASSSSSNSKSSAIPSKTSSSSVGTENPVTAASRPSIFSESIYGSSSKIESQAEMLRLEAELELIEIEKQRIENEKIRLIQIDNILQKYLTGTKVETLFEMPLSSSYKSMISNSGSSNANVGKDLFGKDLFLRLIELINYEKNPVDKTRLLEQYDSLSEEVRRLDNVLYTNIVDDLKKEVLLEENRRKQELKLEVIAKINGTSPSSYEKAMDLWIQQTMKGAAATSNMRNKNNTMNSNSSDSSMLTTDIDEGDDINKYSILNPFDMNNINTDLSRGGGDNANVPNPMNMLPNMIRFPNALPALLLPIIFRSTPLLQQDIDCLKNSVFTSDLMSNLTIESSPYICVFRGNPVPSSSSSSSSSSNQLQEDNLHTESDVYNIYEKIKNRINFFSSDTLIPMSMFSTATTDLGFDTNEDVVNIEQQIIKVSPGLKDRIQLFVLPEDIVSSQQQQQNQQILMNRQMITGVGVPNGQQTPPPLSSLQPPPVTVPTTYLSEKYSGVRYSPIYVVISQSAQPRTPGGLETAVGVGGLLASIVASFIYATDTYSLNKNFMDGVTAGDLVTLDNVIALSGGIIALQLLHETGHALAAYFNKVKISLPYFIPSLQIGHFGAITNMLSFPKNRNQVFDVAISGPVLGFIGSLACLLYGLSLTASASPTELANYPLLPTGFFSSSFLLYQLTDLYLHLTNTLLSNINSAASTIISSGSIGNTDGESLQNQINLISKVLSNSLTPIHPLVITGVSGLFVNAFNFMPIGRLDGGRVFSAIFGRKSAATISTFTLISQSLSLLINSSPLALFWIINVVFLQRGQDIPPLDDITPVSCTISDSSDTGGDRQKKSTTDVIELQTNKNISYYTRLFSFAFCLLMTASMLVPMPLDLTNAAVNAAATAAGGLPNLGGNGFDGGLSI